MKARGLTQADVSVLARVVRPLAPIPDDEWRVFLGGFTVRILEDGEHLLRQGERARFIAFVGRGLLREALDAPDGGIITVDWALPAGSGRPGPPPTAPPPSPPSPSPAPRPPAAAAAAAAAAAGYG